MNFSNMSPSHGCSSTGTAPAWVRSTGCSPSGTKCSSVGPPQGHKPCQQTYSSMDSSVHGSTGPAKKLRKHKLSTESHLPAEHIHLLSVGSSMGCRWICASLRTSMVCRGTIYLTTFFSTSCRGTSTLEPEAPPPPPSSLTLSFAQFFLLCILTPFSCCKNTLKQVFFPFLNILSQKRYHHR